jgi:Leucine-rich repeat (LRR) protein
VEFEAKTRPGSDWIFALQLNQRSDGTTGALDGALEDALLSLYDRSVYSVEFLLRADGNLLAGTKNYSEETRLSVTSDFHKIRLTAKDGRYDLYCDEQYAGGFDGAYDAPAICFYSAMQYMNTSSYDYNIRNFKLTIPSVETTAAPFSLGVKLNWTSVTDRRLGYNIYRSATEGRQGEKINDGPVFAGASGAYADVNVASDTTYYYTIRARTEDEDGQTAVGNATVAAGAQTKVTTGEIAGGAEGKRGFLLMQIGQDTMNVNGALVEIDPGRGTAPLLQNGRTLLPIRAVVEEMGGEAVWEGGEKKVSLSALGHTLVMWIGKTEMTADGQAAEMDVAPAMINDRTMLPLRFAAEALGCPIEWIAATQEIIVAYPLSAVDSASVKSIFIQGERYSTSLTSLDLEYRDLTDADIEPLRHMTNLTELFLRGNEISDISPLAALTNLTTVGLSDTGIGDISALAGLTDLKQMAVSGNQVSDISPLAGLTNLDSLLLGGNQIRDIGLLAGLANLTELDVSSNGISDIGPLAGLAHLERLDAGGNQISDIGPLAGLTNLTSLVLYSNSIRDIDALAGLADLSWLDIDSNRIRDIRPLTGLTHLTGLRVYNNEISDVSPLAGLVNLGQLDVSKNQISDISPLAALTHLTRLYLEDNQISDIKPLAGLMDLGWLNIGDNRISDLGPLAELAHLEILHVKGNQISDWSPVAHVRVVVGGPARRQP